MVDDVMTNERLDQHDRRLDEHGRRLGHIDERLNNQAVRVERHEQILIGDDQLGLTGLVTQLKQISHQLDDITEWRSQIITYGRVITLAVKLVVALLGMIGFGVWWPQLVEWYHWLIGG